MHNKLQLRQTSLTKRSAIAANDYAAWSLSCCQNIHLVIAENSTKNAVIAGYMPFRAELDVTPLFSLLGANYITALPRIMPQEKELSFCRWQIGDPLTSGMYGIREPLENAERVTPSIVIVPLLAFDHTGHRLGYGGGYYDFTLQKLRTVNPSLLAIGAAFSLQEEGLQAETHDMQLHWIITEKEAIQTS